MLLPLPHPVATFLTPGAACPVVSVNNTPLLICLPLTLLLLNVNYVCISMEAGFQKYQDTNFGANFRIS